MEDSVVDLRSVLGLLKRQFRLIVATTLLGILLAGTAAFILTPVYTATALVLVDPSRKNLLDPSLPLSGTSSDSVRLDSEVEIVKSDNVLMRVVQDLEMIANTVNAEPGIRTRLLTMLRLAEPTEPTPDELINNALSSLRSALNVERRGLTYLISVQARSASPTEAALLANAVSNAYIADQLQSKIDSLLTARDVLDARTAEARAAIVQSEGSFDRFIGENIAQISQDTNRPELLNIQQQIDALIEERNRTYTLADSVERDLAGGANSQIFASLRSSAIVELNSQREALKSQLDQAGAQGNAASLRAELEALDGRLRAAAQNEVTEMRNRVTQSQTREATLRQNLRTAVLDSPLSASTLTQLFEMQQTANIARSQYENLLARTRDLETQAELQLPDSRIVSPAIAPQSPSFPNRPLIVVMAALAALGVGVGLALLYENLIGGFTSEAQMQAVLKRPVVAVIPLQKSKDGSTPANAIVNAPLSLLAEGIRRVKAAVEQSLRNRGADDSRGRGKVVMLTSSAPGDGKTTLALGLARSFAISGRSTLLIDSDLRKPSIHTALGIHPSQGLLDFLRSNQSITDFMEIVGRDTHSSAMYIVGSKRSSIPTDQLVDGTQFASLIQAARKSFDIIILDTPPTEPVVDGLYLSRYADVIVLTTRWASTSQTAVKKALSQLTGAKSPDTDILLVLNQQNESQQSRRRKYAEYYVDPD